MVIALYLLANLAYLAALPLQSNPRLEAQVQSLEEKAEYFETPGQKAAAETAQNGACGRL